MAGVCRQNLFIRLEKEPHDKRGLENALLLSVALAVSFVLLPFVAEGQTADETDLAAKAVTQPAQADATQDAGAGKSSESVATRESIEDDPRTLFPHSEASRFWISGQANIILQWHPSFHAAYNGTNSLRSHAENATSKLYTLYTGVQLTHTTEVVVDAESAGGHDHPAE